MLFVCARFVREILALGPFGFGIKKLVNSIDINYGSFGSSVQYYGAAFACLLY